jgi:hypothetical protein
MQANVDPAHHFAFCLQPCRASAAADGCHVARRYADGYADGYTGDRAYGYTCAHCGTFHNGFADGRTDADSDRHAHAHVDADGNCYAYSHADPHADAYCHTYSRVADAYARVGLR